MPTLQDVTVHGQLLKTSGLTMAGIRTNRQIICKESRKSLGFLSFLRLVIDLYFFFEMRQYRSFLGLAPEGTLLDKFRIIPTNPNTDITDSQPIVAFLILGVLQ